MLTVKKAKAIYANHSIELDDVDAALVAYNCNNKAEDSSKSAEDWAHIWAAAENFADLEITYEGATRGH
jgi:hypothetical protein